MNELNNGLELERTMINLSEFSLTEPKLLVKIDDGSRYILSKTAEKVIAGAFNLGGAQTSNKLFSIQEDLWRELVARRYLDNNIKELTKNYIALVVEDEILTITDGDPNLRQLSDLASVMKSKGYNLYYNYSNNKDLFNLIIINEAMYGILIRYYNQSNWVEGNEIYYDRSNKILRIVPASVMSMLLTDNELIPDDIASYIDGYESVSKPVLDVISEDMSKTYLSIEELLGYMKSSLKLKLGLDMPAIEEVAAQRELMPDSTLALRKILELAYGHPGCISDNVYSPYLVKATSMTNITFEDIYDYFTKRFLEDENPSINHLLGITDLVSSKESHFDQLNS